MERMQIATDVERGGARPAASRRTRAIVVGATVVGLAAGIALVFGLGGRSAASAQSVVATIRVPGHPGWITVGEDAMWLSMNCDIGGPCQTRGFVRIDLATGAVDRTVALEGEPSFSIRVGDALIAGYSPNGFGKPSQVLRLDWTTGDILARASFPYGSGQLAAGDGQLWLSAFRPDNAGIVQQLDPVTLRPIGEPLQYSGHYSNGLAYGGGMLWASASVDSQLVRIDPRTGDMAQVTVGRFPVGIAVAGGSVWVANRESGTVSRVDPTTMTVVGEIETGGNSTWIIGAAGSVWVASQDEGTVTRIDAVTGERIGQPIRIAEPSTTDAAAQALAASEDSVWVTSLTEDTVSRIDPSR